MSGSGAKVSVALALTEGEEGEGSLDKQHDDLWCEPWIEFAPSQAEILPMSTSSRASVRVPGDSQGRRRWSLQGTVSVIKPVSDA